MIRKFLPKSVRRTLEKLLPFLRPQTEVTFAHTNLGYLGLCWNSYMNEMPPSMAISESHSFSLGKVHVGPLLLRLELPEEVDDIKRGPDDYGPLLFLLLHIQRGLRHVNIVVSKAAHLGYVHVHVDADSREVFNQEVSAHYVDDDDPPHIVLK